MYCRNCGKEIKSDVAFCPYCGAAQPIDSGTAAGTDAGQTNNNVQGNDTGQGNAGQGNYAGQANFYGQANNQEVVIEKARLHWVVLMPYLPLAILLAILIFPIGLIIALILMVEPIVKYATTTLQFTNKRLIGKQGFIKTQNLDAPLNKINNVYVNSDFWGKILGYGVLVISTSSGEYKYKAIRKPEEFQNALMQQIDQFENDQIRRQAMEMASAMNAAMNGYGR